MNYFVRLTETEILDIITSLRVNRMDVRKHLRIIEDKKRKSKADKQMVEISKMYESRLYELETRLQNLMTDVNKEIQK